jgi:hypothetical protein
MATTTNKPMTVSAGANPQAALAARVAANAPRVAAMQKAAAPQVAQIKANTATIQAGGTPTAANLQATKGAQQQAIEARATAPSDKAKVNQAAQAFGKELLGKGWTQDFMGNYVNKETGDTLTYQDLRSKAETQQAKDTYQASIQKPEAITKANAPTSGPAPTGIKDTKEYQVSTPGQTDQKYTVTSSGGILNEKGQLLSEVERDRLGRTAGMVEYNRIGPNGENLGTFLAPDTGFTANEGIQKVGDHQAVEISNDPNQKLGHKVLPPAEVAKIPEDRATANQVNSAFEGAQPGEYSTDLQTGFVPEAVEDPKERVNQALENTNKGSFGDLMNQAASMDWENMSSADALKANLLMTLQANEIGDDSINEFLSNSAYNAQQSYKSTIENLQLSREEIGKAVSGEEFIPQTYEGLQAQILEKQSDLQIESIEEQKKYQQEQMDVWKKDTVAKRGRLEGYLKAQLVAMGASDSTAGLSVMAMQVNQADLQIQQQESEYNHGLAQLNLQARGIMTDFTNQVLTLNMQTKTAEGEAQTTLNDKLDGIEKESILNEKEKNKAQMVALSDYSTKLQTLKKDQKDEQWRLMEFNYGKIRDAKDEAYKLSGMTGSIFVTDESGNLIDTGVETFDNKKWQASNYLEEQRFNWDMQKGSYDLAINLVEQGMDSGSIEQLVGMPSGSLSQLKSKEEIKQAIETQKDANMWGAMLGDIGKTADGVDNALGFGTSNVISNACDDGSYGGQCAYWGRTTFTTLGPVGDLLSTKLQRADNTLKGFKLGNIPENIINMISQATGVGGVVSAIADPIMKKYADMLPRLGDQLIMDVGTTFGHWAAVNSVNPPNDKFPAGSITLSESNWKGDEKVSNTRTISRTDPSIVGINRGNLKPEYQQMIDKQQQSTQKVLSSGNPEDVVLNSGFLSNVAKGTTKLTVDQEISLANSRPDVMEYYNYAKMMSTEQEKEGASTADIRMLRKEFYGRPSVVNAGEAIKNFSNLSATFEGYKQGKYGANAVDQGLVMMFNKMLDPGSVVREGEYDRTKQGQSAVMAIQGSLDQLSKGGAGISDKTRADMVALAKELSDASNNRLQREIDFYSEEARNLGVDPSRILGSYSDMGFSTESQTNLAPATMDQSFLDLYGGGSTSQPKTALPYMGGQTW